MTTPLVAGRYRLGARLGSGGTADVYAAEDEASGRAVAVKVLHARLSGDASQWDAFFEEVRAARSVDHPGVVTILDWGVDPGDPPRAWIAMELVAGTTLSAEVRRSGPLAPAVTVAVADALLAALEAAHTRSVVHRDVTPANVMLDVAAGEPSGDPAAVAASVRLLDFGLADIPGRSTAGGDVLLSTAGGAGSGVIASVPFASPEHLRGEPVTEASDVYQVAATVFFALTGTTPYLGDAEAQRIGHLEQRPATLAARGVAGLGAFDAVLRTAMRKAPVARYPDAAALRIALAEAAAAADLSLTAFAPPAATVEARTSVLPLPADPRTSRLPAAVSRSAGIPPAPSVRHARSRRLPMWGVALGGAAAITAIIAVAATATPTAGPVAAPSPSVTESVTPTATATSTPTVTPRDVALVPDVAGLSSGDAAARLSAAGLALGAETPVDGADAIDTVLSSDPAPGTTVDRGARIALRVASGRNAVPALVGRTVGEASQLLRTAGFAVSATDPSEAIVSGSQPVEGQILAHGATVALAALPRATATPVASPTPTRATPTPSPTPTVVVP